MDLDEGWLPVTCTGLVGPWKQEKDLETLSFPWNDARTGSDRSQEKGVVPVMAASRCAAALRGEGQDG